jgi:hypothetical protein
MGIGAGTGTPRLTAIGLPPLTLTTRLTVTSLAQQAAVAIGVAGPRLTTTCPAQRTWTGLGPGPDPAALAMATPGTAASSESATPPAAAIVLIFMLER